ncbi:MAG: DUF4007 family protein [Bdellovibrionales bacterium]|nr:DUF4007 family protein [Bdellovibrionales bacterium]
MKFAGHQSFHLRDQWLYKGIYWTKKSPQILFKKNTEIAMREMGIGKNMIDSLIYWLKVSNLIKLNQTSFMLTKTASQILEKDSYFELDGTLFLLHYFIATNKEEATAWHWFFNHFSANEFEKESLENAFSTYIQLKTNKQIKETTLNKDLNCLLRMYQSIDWKGRNNPETENPSPFTKYGWIEKKAEKFIRNKLNRNDLNIHIFSYLIYTFWKKELARPKSMKLEDVSLEENSPGRIFDFSLEEMNDLIDSSSKTNSYLNYSRTGGYFIIQLNEKNIKKSLDNYYKEMNLNELS